MKEPLAAPIAVSFCLFLSGTNASISSLNFNLFPAWEDKCTVGVQPPDIQMQSHSTVSSEIKDSFEESSLPMIAEFIFKCPLVSAIPELNFIEIPFC